MTSDPNGRKRRGAKRASDESEKSGLKLNIQKTKIITSNPVTSLQIEGEKVEIVTDYFLGLQNHH